MRVGHMHVHACEVCSATVPFRQTSDAKGLKMCPCRAAFYCGSEHQKLHWKIHRTTCYAKAHPGPLTPMDVAINHLMQFHDASAVQFLVGALIKAKPDCDLVEELERTAAVITLEQAVNEESMSVAVDAGRIPPYTISNVALVSLVEEIKRRGHPEPFFEDPFDRQRRLECGDLIVTLIFQPGGRIFTKRILSHGPARILETWQMVQKNSKLPEFARKGPWIDYLVYSANMRIGSERDEERKVPARAVTGLVQFNREEFLKDGIGRVHLKPTKSTGRVNPGEPGPIKIDFSAKDPNKTSVADYCVVC
ncbi:hypothetical protein B0H11DRAFT_2078676 [Mycena galericulata]|nr:hypothetical protein B0H11DRAFT_2078676 [Mycena galericulata]